MNTEATPSGKRLKLIGFISIALGIVALAAPAVAAGAVVIIVGLTLLAAGIVQVVQGLGGESWRDKGMPVILGVISGLAGILVLAHPVLGLGTLTLLLVAYFVVEGIWKIIASFKFRPNPGWIWLLLGGGLSLVLGILIWNQWPLSGVWAIGMLVGIDLLTTGISLVVLGSAVKELSK